MLSSTTSCKWLVDDTQDRNTGGFEKRSEQDGDNWEAFDRETFLIVAFSTVDVLGGGVDWVNPHCQVIQAAVKVAGLTFQGICIEGHLRMHLGNKTYIFVLKTCATTPVEQGAMLQSGSTRLVVA